jgi:hypothetical protein
MQPNSREEELKQEVESWIASFAPLLMEDGELTSSEIQDRLEDIRQLRRSGGVLNMRSGSLRAPEYAELLETFEDAWARIDPLEKQTKEALARLKADTGAQAVNLVDTEVERTPTVEPSEPAPKRFDFPGGILREVVSRPSSSKAAGLGCFAIFWNGFTLIHMFFMIRGMYESFGAVAFLLLLFYAIFLLVGAAVAHSAILALSTQSIVISGRKLTRTRVVLGWKSTKSWVINPGSPAIMASPTSPVMKSGTNQREKEIALKSAEGERIFLGAPVFESDQKVLIEKINAYLAEQS